MFNPSTQFSPDRDLAKSLNFGKVKSLMAVPKQRKTKSRRDQGRMHYYVSAPTLVNCSKCGKPKKPHTVCDYCGYYRGREVIDVLKDLGKQERKKRQKEEKQSQQQSAEN